MADMSREEVPARYRHLRAIGTRHHTEALRFLSRPALLEQARQLGLTAGGMLVAESMDEFTLVVDLAIHATRPGRSRAIDRYAGAAQLQPGSDEALVLEAMRRARFSLWRVERRHEVVGLVVQDLLREGEAWLVDEAMERSAPAGMVAAMRLCTPETFAMTCGVIVPVDRELLEEVIATVRLAGPGRRRSPVRDRDLPHGGGEGADGTGRLRGGTAPGPLTASMRSSSRPKMAKVELTTVTETLRGLQWGTGRTTRRYVIMTPLSAIRSEMLSVLRRLRYVSVTKIRFSQQDSLVRIQLGVTLFS